MHEAILEELGLMPLWQLRQQTMNAPVIAGSLPISTELIIVPVRREDAAPGWVVMDEPLPDDAAVLFANMLRAMRLHQADSMQIADVQLRDMVISYGVSWIWLVGEGVAQRVLETTSPLAALSAEVLQWQHLPVFVSLHPRELVLRPQDKAGVWVGWCDWIKKH